LTDLLKGTALNICVDIGNTTAKAGIFENDVMVEEKKQLSDRAIVRLVMQLKPDAVIIASVRKGVKKIVREVESQTKTVVLKHGIRLPFVNNYGTPATLGVDRIAAVAGAVSLYPAQACLIIDVGTCITYDLVDSKGVYHGGGISPGIEMRLKAMHKFTSKLPAVMPGGKTELIGKTTRECMLSGAMIGSEAEVQGIIDRYTQYFPQLSIIFCGGGTHFFESKIKGHIFAVPNLVLIGLDQILSMNVND
jgi:type III pantothenate kinase